MYEGIKECGLLKAHCYLLFTSYDYDHFSTYIELTMQNEIEASI